MCESASHRVGRHCSKIQRGQERRGQCGPQEGRGGEFPRGQQVADVGLSRVLQKARALGRVEQAFPVERAFPVEGHCAQAGGRGGPCLRAGHLRADHLRAGCLAVGLSVLGNEKESFVS